jgi:hypothetical protein
LLRRSGQLDDAERLCSELLQKKDLDDKTKQVLAYQQDLIEAKDAAKHTIGEAVEDSE